MTREQYLKIRDEIADEIQAGIAIGEINRWAYDPKDRRDYEELCQDLNSLDVFLMDRGWR